MSFFKKTRTRSYNLFDNYSHYAPNTRGIIILLLLFLLGQLLGGLVGGLLALFADVETMMKYNIVIAYPIGFIPAMIYASMKSRSNSFFDQSLPLDNGKFGSMGGFYAAGVVSIVTIAAAVVMDPFTALLPEVSDVVRLAMVVNHVERLHTEFFLHLTVNEEACHLVVTLNGEFNGLTFGNAIIECVEIPIAFETEFAFLGIREVEVRVGR